jgi:hypothetical protein
MNRAVQRLAGRFRHQTVRSSARPRRPRRQAARYGTLPLRPGAGRTVRHPAPPSRRWIVWYSALPDGPGAGQRGPTACRAVQALARAVQRLAGRSRRRRTRSNGMPKGSRRMSDGPGAGPSAVFLYGFPGCWTGSLAAGPAAWPLDRQPGRWTGEPGRWTGQAAGPTSQAAGPPAVFLYGFPGRWTGSLAAVPAAWPLDRRAWLLDRRGWPLGRPPCTGTAFPGALPAAWPLYQQPGRWTREPGRWTREPGHRTAVPAPVRLVPAPFRARRPLHHQGVSHGGRGGPPYAFTRCLAHVPGTCPTEGTTRVVSPSALAGDLALGPS